MRELRKSRNRRLMGVAAGMAEYFEMDPTIWRAIWIFGCIVMPPAILAYFILGFVIPEPLPGPAPIPTQAPAPAPDPAYAEPGYAGAGYTAPPRTYKPLTKSNDRWLAGVCGGIAEYLEVDPLIVRALFLAGLFLVGGSLLLYIVLAIVMPRPAYR